jgi:LPS-assembly lipoprotein
MLRKKPSIAGRLGMGTGTGTSRLVVLAALTFVLGGCGFHLQGRAPLPPALATARVIADDDQTDFVQGLRRALLASGGKLTESSERATGIVRIHKDEVSQKIISVSAQNIPREYEVTYTVEFSVEGTSGELLPSQEVSITRDYSFDETKLLAKENEEAILREGMARDLVAIVMRRLSAI